MGNPKVILGNETLIDLTNDTVDASHLAEGYTAHDHEGNPIVGEMSGGDEYTLYAQTNQPTDPNEGDIWVETGASDLYDEEDDVCFWDYDGTLVYSCSKIDAYNMTSLPPLPDHSEDIVPLTAIGWNWTLEDLHNLQRKADIGAIYKPTDNKNHLFVNMTERYGLTFTIEHYNRTGNATVEWGDGNTETITGTGEKPQAIHIQITANIISK